MSIFSELEIGDKLSIEIKEKDAGQDENNMLNAQLIDIDTNYLYISSPVYKGKKYDLHKNQKVTVFFYRKKGIYQFDAQIISRIDTNIGTYILNPLGDILKIQRRNYYRLPIVISAILKIQQGDEIIEFRCNTKDLSGGGVQVACKNEIKKLENVIIDLYIDEKQAITMNGQVVRILKDAESNTYELGIKFKNTNEVDADRIFAFIFEKQRLLRKKGLI